MVKYKLPEVDSLKGIGFVFKFNRQNEVNPYLNNYVGANIISLVGLFHPDFLNWADHNRITHEVINEPEYGLVAKYNRVKQGHIRKDDYLGLVPGMYRNDKEKLLVALDKRLRTYYGAKGNLIYRGNRWNMDIDMCIKECLHHELLDRLIKMIASEGKILPAEINHTYLRHLKYKTKAKELEHVLVGQPGSLFYRMYDLQASKDLKIFFDEMFLKNPTLEKTACYVIRKALNGGPIISSIDQKERTLRYYIKLQSGSVRKSRDNQKGNKGIQLKNRKKVIKIYKLDPEKSISEISRISGVTRKTIARIIAELKTE